MIIKNVKKILIILFYTIIFADAELNLNKDQYLVGEHIEVFFSDLENYTNNWIGIFQEGATNYDYLYWLYTNGTQYNEYDMINSGMIYFSPISLPVGNYEIRLFYNDTYDAIINYLFTITDSCIEPSSSIYEDTFKVMTFNTWYSGQYGYGGLPRIAEIVMDLDIDIVGFQETDFSSIIEIQSLLENNDGYEETYTFTTEWNTRILSKYPILDIYDFNLYRPQLVIIETRHRDPHFINNFPDMVDNSIKSVNILQENEYREVYADYTNSIFIDKTKDSIKGAIFR